MKNKFIGLTRDELVSILGEPDDKGAVSRKYPTPSVYKYGDIEYHFTPWKQGKIVCVMRASTHEIIDKLED